MEWKNYFLKNSLKSYLSHRILNICSIRERYACVHCKSLNITYEKVFVVILIDYSSPSSFSRRLNYDFYCFVYPI